jgi:hypothetical protein
MVSNGTTQSGKPSLTSLKNATGGITKSGSEQLLKIPFGLSVVSATAFFVTLKF